MDIVLAKLQETLKEHTKTMECISENFRQVKEEVRENTKIMKDTKKILEKQLQVLDEKIAKETDENLKNLTVIRKSHENHQEMKITQTRDKLRKTDDNYESPIDKIPDNSSYRRKITDHELNLAVHSSTGIKGNIANQRELEKKRKRDSKLLEYNHSLDKNSKDSKDSNTKIVKKSKKFL